MAAEDGTYPVDLNTWELRVLDADRNPSRATKESLAIAYRAAANEWKAMRPDFLFFSTNDDGTVVSDLVDPHGHHLADALPKLKGLADFAADYSNEFRRIESVAETDGKLRVLDFTREDVREAVLAGTDATALYRSNAATDYA